VLLLAIQVEVFMDLQITAMMSPIMVFTAKPPVEGAVE
jgi:hypothetical protein